MPDPTFSTVSSDESFRLLQKTKALESRQKLLQIIRDFFCQHSFLEVTTPVQVQAPALEEHIDCPSCGDHQFLRASPELHMKRLLAALNRPLFQIGPCFREGERGPFHLPEFTMLEWYRQQADCMDILDDTIDLLRRCAENITGGGVCHFRNQRIDFNGRWQVRSVENAFNDFADLSLDQAVKDDTFEQILVEQVLPAACGEVPLVLHDFPMTLGGLARKNPGSGRAERWELFVAGVELANAYTELTDWQEQVERFQTAERLRKLQQRKIYPLDRNYMDLLKRGFPDCSGIALGFDRLLMVLLELDTIDQVVPFVPEDEAVSDIDTYPG